MRDYVGKVADLWAWRTRLSVVSLPALHAGDNQGTALFRGALGLIGIFSKGLPQAGRCGDGKQGQLRHRSAVKLMFFAPVSELERP